MSDQTSGPLMVEQTPEPLPVEEEKEEVVVQTVGPLLMEQADKDEQTQLASQDDAKKIALWIELPSSNPHHQQGGIRYHLPSHS